MVSIKACDESSAPPGKKTMGNQWLIKLMLYSPPGYKYSRRSEGERLGWDLRGSKAAPQRSRGINWDFVLYDGLGKQCSTFDVPEVFVALGPFRTEAPCVAFTGFQALSQRFRQNAIKFEKHLRLRFWGEYNSLQQQITISHSKDHQELSLS